MKKALIVLLIGLAVWSAKAEYYLYWNYEVPDTVTDVTFTYAKLAAYTSGDYYTPVGYLTVGDTTSDMIAAYGITASQLTGTSVSEVYFAMGSYNSNAYSFRVELFDSGNNFVGRSDAYDYATVSGSIYSDMSIGGMVPLSMGGYSAVPEPTSGMMLLLGMGLLALKRKRREEAANRGKSIRVKPLALMAFMLTALTCFGAANDLIIAFSTPGVDKYSDGTTVLDGERYALVWAANGKTFGGIKADGTAVDAADKVIAIAPVAKDGRCPLTIFEINASFAKALEGGSYSLYLLDTRTSAAELAATVGGKPETVNRLGLVASASESADGSALTMTAAGAVALGTVGVYTEIESPRITTMKLNGAKIELTVEGMSGAADYFVVPGAKVGEFGEALEVKPEGNVFTVDAAGDAKFFKVIGVRKFE